MVNCSKCGTEIKKLGHLIPNVEGAEYPSIFVCFKADCPNFCLTQVGLSEVKDDN